MCDTLQTMCVTHGMPCVNMGAQIQFIWEEQQGEGGGREKRNGGKEKRKGGKEKRKERMNEEKKNEEERKKKEEKEGASCSEQTQTAKNSELCYKR